MTKSKYFAGGCAVSVSVLFSWTLLIGACSRNHVAPAQDGKPAAISRSSPTPDPVAKAAASPQDTATPAQPDKADANSQDADMPAKAIPIGACAKSRKLLEWQKIMQISKNELYLYTVKLFKQPTVCEGKVQKEGSSSMVFTFANGSTFNIIAGPDSANYQIRAAGGFPNENEARSFIKKYTAEQFPNGLEDIWSKPEKRLQAGEQVYTYWVPGEGINIGADMAYKNKKLVGIGYHSVD